MLSGDRLGPWGLLFENVLFVHAVLGRDTISRLFGLGKGLAVSKLKNDSTFLQQTQAFGNVAQNMDTLVDSDKKSLHGVILRWQYRRNVMVQAVPFPSYLICEMTRPF